jgi:hypothetical protein
LKKLFESVAMFHPVQDFLRQMRHCPGGAPR